MADMPVSLVTGATAGIGAAFAKALAARGHDLVLVARDAERLAKTAAALEARYAVSVEVLEADLGVEAGRLRVACRLEDPELPIDLLVNNAGFGVASRLLDPDTSSHRDALEVMCYAVLVLGGAAARAMKVRGHGRIINVSSLASWTTQGNYSAVKAWVRSYSQGLGNELHGSGVTVTVLCPGWVRTEFHQRAGIRTSSIPEWYWVDADRVAKVALRDAAVGKVISIPAKRWRLARALLSVAPASAVRAVSRLLVRSRVRAGASG